MKVMRDFLVIGIVMATVMPLAWGLTLPFGVLDEVVLSKPVVKREKTSTTQKNTKKIEPSSVLGAGVTTSPQPPRDETTEWSDSALIPAKYRESSHANFTHYNHGLLITGEVAGDDARQEIGEAAERTRGIRFVQNELTVGPVSTLTSRADDADLSSRIRARLIATNQISVNRVKVVCERGIAYLMGVVSEREATVAISVVRTTNGVLKVVSIMEVLPENEIRRIEAVISRDDVK